MKIDFEELYGDTPYICRSCLLDCSSCPFDSDIFILAAVDDLNMRIKMHEMEIERLSGEGKKLQKELKKYQDKPAEADEISAQLRMLDERIEKAYEEIKKIKAEIEAYKRYKKQ